MVYRKRRNIDVVVAFDGSAHKHIAVFFKHSARNFQRCVEH